MISTVLSDNEMAQCFLMRRWGSFIHVTHVIIWQGPDYYWRSSTGAQKPSHTWVVLVKACFSFQLQRVCSVKMLSCLESDNDVKPKRHLFTIHTVHSEHLTWKTPSLQDGSVVGASGKATCDGLASKFPNFQLVNCFSLLCYKPH